MASIDCVAEVIQGSSIQFKIYVRDDNVLTDPDVLTVTTISPAEVIETYTFDGGITGNILQDVSVHPSGVYDFSSQPTDEDGTWFAEITITFNLAGGAIKSLVWRVNVIIEDDYKT